MTAAHGGADPATLDALPDPVVVVQEGHVVAANALAVRLLGADPVGAAAPRAVPLVDEAGEDWWGGDGVLDADPTVAERIPERDLQLRTASGARPVVLTGARRRGAQGVTLVLSLRRGERRRRLDAARSDLVSTVSHELRSPLTAVKGFTKTLLAKWDRFNDEQKLQMLATVNADADRVTRLLGELLDVSRIDAGRLRLQRREVDVRALLDAVAERFAAVDPPADVVVEGASRTVLADPDKLAQVLANLVENAVKYGAGEITARADGDEASVRLTVADEGGAISEDHLPHLFTKFYRRGGERHTGTGLGLFIAKGIVEAHGGRLWAESTPSVGTRFHVELPGGSERDGRP